MDEFRWTNSSKMKINQWLIDIVMSTVRGRNGQETFERLCVLACPDLERGNKPKWVRVPFVNMFLKDDSYE